MTNQVFYTVDHLFLLVGENPLPNYVVAHLLFKQADQSDIQKTETGYIILLHSKETGDTASILKKVLEEEQFLNIKTVNIDTVDRLAVYNAIRKIIEDNALEGEIGFNYTGGTKIMALYGYLAFQHLSQPEHSNNKPAFIQNPVQYSYLDARSLSMKIEGKGGPEVRDVWKLVKINLHTLAKLHDLDLLDPRKHMTTKTVWDKVQNALIKIYVDDTKTKQWTDFLSKIRPGSDASSPCPNPTIARSDQPMSELLPADICPVFQKEGIDPSITLAQFEMVEPFKNKENLYKWLHGIWFEQYVYRQLKPLEKAGDIHDLVMTVNPYISRVAKLEFEIDIAFLRGYQLFAISCTTARDSKPCKQKLIEMVVRAEQLGGREAQIALVSCANATSNIQQQVSKLLYSRNVKVFGKDDLRNNNLSTALQKWFRDVSS